MCDGTTDLGPALLRMRQTSPGTQLLASAIRNTFKRGGGQCPGRIHCEEELPNCWAGTWTPRSPELMACDILHGTLSSQKYMNQALQVSKM